MNLPVNLSISLGQFPAPWGEGWLKASGLKSAVNTSRLAAGCFINLVKIYAGCTHHACSLFYMPSIPNMKNDFHQVSAALCVD